MDPRTYQLTLVIMAFLIVLAYSAVAYGALKLYAAKKALSDAGYCEQPFYSRGYVAEAEGCHELCTNECVKREKPVAHALLITQGYEQDRTDVLVSCECTCGTCRS